MANPKPNNQITSIDDKGTGTQNGASEKIEPDDIGVKNIIDKWGHLPVQCLGMVKDYLAKGE